MIKNTEETEMTEMDFLLYCDEQRTKASLIIGGIILAIGFAIGYSF